jgi:hypothetical protein
MLAHLFFDNGEIVPDREAYGHQSDRDAYGHQSHSLLQHKHIGCTPTAYKSENSVMLANVTVNSIRTIYRSQKKFVHIDTQLCCADISSIRSARSEK